MSEDRDRDRALLGLIEAASNDNRSHPLDRIHALAVRALNDPAVMTADEIRDIAWTALLFAHRQIQQDSGLSIDEQIHQWQSALGELAN